MLKMILHFKVFIFLGFLSSCREKSEKTISEDLVEKNKSNGYLIDSSLQGQIDEKVRDYNLKANSTISWKAFENGKVIASGNKEGDPAVAFTSLIDGSIGVDCTNGMNEGIGFTLVLSEDTTLVKLNVFSSEQSIQFAESENADIQPQILVPCSSYKIQLARKPRFAEGEIVQGKVELVSEPFYQIDNGSKRQLTFQLTAFFRSEPLPVTGNQYKTLKKD